MFSKAEIVQNKSLKYFFLPLTLEELQEIHARPHEGNFLGGASNTIDRCSLMRVMATQPPPPFPKLPSRKAETASQKGVDLLVRVGPWVAIVLAIALYIGQSFTPIEVFATEGERREFLSSVGASESTRIIALVTEWCPACKSLEHNLQAKGVEFVRIDIERHDAGRRLFRRVFELTGSNSIPKVILDRNLVSQMRMYEELDKKEL